MMVSLEGVANAHAKVDQGVRESMDFKTYFCVISLNIYRFIMISNWISQKGPPSFSIYSNRAVKYSAIQGAAITNGTMNRTNVGMARDFSLSVLIKLLSELQTYTY